MSMQVSEYDSDDNDSYGNNGVSEERHSWRMDTQSSPDKYMCMQGQMNHHQPPHHHHMQSPSGSHRMGSQFQPQYFPQSQTPPMHQYSHVQHQQPPQQKPRQMGSGYMVEPMQGDLGGRCDVPPPNSNKASAVPSPSMGGNITPKPSQHQFVMGTVKRRGRPPKPESEKKAKKEPKARGRPRNSVLQVAIGNKKPSSASTPNSNIDNSSLQESPFPLLPSAYTSLTNTDSGKKSRGRPRIHPQKDPSVKRQRGRPRVNPLVGEDAWKAECGKLRRNLKKKDEVIGVLKAKLVELGQPVDELIAQARSNRQQAGNSGEEDEEQNGANNAAPVEGASGEEPQQKYHHGYYAGEDSRNNGNQQSSIHQHSGDGDDDDDDDDDDEEEEEVEEVNISSNTSMSNNPHHNNHDNNNDEEEDDDDEDDDDDGSREFD